MVFDHDGRSNVFSGYMGYCVYCCTVLGPMKPFPGGCHEGVLRAGGRTMKIRYKVLTDDCCSPYQGHQYEIGKWYEEPRIGEPGDSGCVCGLYAGPIESLLNRGVWRGNESVWRCEVDGKSAGDPPSKECWERLRVINRMTDKQVKALARRHHDRLGYNLVECLYPHDPRSQNPGEPGPDVIQLLREWASVRSSVWVSVGASVGVSVGYSMRVSVWNSVCVSVGDSVCDSVEDSMRGSVWDYTRAYVGSLFNGIKTWKYVDHEPGVYPFQSGADLWKMGYIPSYDGKKWRLHARPDMEVVWEEK